MDAAPLLFVLAIIVVATVAYVQWKREQARREALFSLCVQRSWTYERRDDSWVQRLRGEFPLFRAGDGRRRCENVVSTGAGGPGDGVFMDYSYVTRHHSKEGTSERTHRHAVALLVLPDFLPELRLASEGVLSRLASAAGFRDIELESAEFNRRFRLKAPNRAHAFDVLHPRAIEFLLAQRLDDWELVGQRLLVSTSGRWALADYEQVLEQMRAFVELIPGYVWRKHGAEPPAASS